MFDTKVSQAELAKEFSITEKKLHMVVSGCKYDQGKKTSKCKTELKEPKAATATKTVEPKTQEATDTPTDTQQERERWRISCYMAMTMMTMIFPTLSHQ